MSRRLAVAVLLTMLALPSFAAKVEKRTLRSGETDRTYYLYVPDGIDKDHPAPLLVTLHGSGRDGKILVEKWKELADESKIILAGPDATNRQGWSSPVDGPDLLHDLVEHLKKDLPVDPRRVYLFGHSAGGGFALQMGLLESEYFAAIAVHAGAVHPEGFNVTSYAQRKIPFVLVVGARDPLIPAEAVRATRDHLQKEGFVAELTEIPNHTHDYYGRSAFINERIWTFLKAQALAGDPKYKQYVITR